MTFAAAVLLAAGVEVWRPGGRRLLAVRRRRPVPPLRLERFSPTLLLAPALPVAIVLLHGPALLLAAAGAVSGVALAEVVRRGRARSRAADRRRRLVEALSFLVSELRAGALPEHALSVVADDEPLLAPVARAAVTGVDVVAVLDAAAARPGCEALAALGAAWSVADRSGAPVADVVARLADRVRDDLELDREVEAELAPARATGRLMALLPVAGLLLGSGIGGDPIAVVTGTWVGAVAASLGLLLGTVGVVWVERVAAGVPR